MYPLRQPESKPKRLILYKDNPMSIITITHGERRTLKCLIVRSLTSEMDEPILAWIPPGEAQQIEMPEDGELVLSMQEMGLSDHILDVPDITSKESDLKKARNKSPEKNNDKNEV